MTSLDQSARPAAAPSLLGCLAKSQWGQGSMKKAVERGQVNFSVSS